MTLQVKDEQALAKLFATMFKHVADTTPTQVMAHGSSGLFNSQANPDVINAIMLPQYGLLSVLPVTTTQYENPNIMILTGITANSGSHPTDVCDPGKVAGNLAKAEIRFPFGNNKFSTKIIAVSEVGMLNNRADFTDFRLVGGTVDFGPVTPTINATPSDALNSEFQKMMLEAKLGWAQEYGQLLYTADPSNNAGDYREFMGLNLLINTPYNDVAANPLPANAIPLVRSALTGNISTTPAEGVKLVQEIHAVMRTLKIRAARSRMNPVEWVIAMNANAFYEVTSVWPCSYFTYRCAGDTNTPNMTNAADLRREVDAMRQGQYLLVDGEKVRVVVDDAITETALTAGGPPAVPTGEYTSSIYFIPLRARGRNISYVEAFNFNNPQAREIISAMGKTGKYGFSDGGRFMWIYRENAECLQADVRERSRVVIEAPFLSARIASIKYQPVIASEAAAF